MKSWLSFVGQALVDYNSIGTIFPTSKYLANSILRSLVLTKDSKVLEVGAGLGSITMPLVNCIDTFSHLTVCEINPKFMRLLETKLNNQHIYQVNRSKVELFEGAIQNYSTKMRFDHIVCSLPFFSLDRNTSLTILDHLRSLASKNAKLTFVEHVGARRLIKVVELCGGKSHARTSKLLLSPSCSTNEWRNLPPLSICSLPLDMMVQQLESAHAIEHSPITETNALSLSNT